MKENIKIHLDIIKDNNEKLKLTAFEMRVPIINMRMLVELLKDLNHGDTLRDIPNMAVLGMDRVTYIAEEIGKKNKDMYKYNELSDIENINNISKYIFDIDSEIYELVEGFKIQNINMELVCGKMNNPNAEGLRVISSYFQTKFEMIEEYTFHIKESVKNIGKVLNSN